MPPPAAGGSPLRRERIVAALTLGILAAAAPLDQWMFPDEGEKHTPVTLVAGFASVLGHAMWISMDRRRRGRQVGAWRFFAICLAPLAIPAYLVLEYRWRGLLGAVVYFLLLATALLLGGAGAYGVYRLQGGS